FNELSSVSDERAKSRMTTNVMETTTIVRASPISNAGKSPIKDGFGDSDGFELICAEPAVTDLLTEKRILTVVLFPRSIESPSFRAFPAG
ncbi:hypothetical protein OFM04_32635, partial [Escherichia coli]|nr:hypothetical protein [Escherichia coli]